MWTNNILTERLDLAWPIIQAPMAGAATPALAATVSNAGGLGSLGLGTVSPDIARGEIERFRQMSAKPLNTNFFCHEEIARAKGPGKDLKSRLQQYFEEFGKGTMPESTNSYTAFTQEHADMLIAQKPETISFHFGLPSEEVLAQLRGTGALILCSATTVAEACYLEKSGVDAIIAQGNEAGGHRGTFLGGASRAQPGLFALLPQICAAVKVPVIAAGGIVDANTAAATIMLGSQGVQVGTAFLRNKDAKISDAYRRALAQAGDESSRVTRLHSGRPARAICNRLMDELADLEDQVASYPAQRSLVAPLAGVGEGAFEALWAGQNVGLTQEIDAAELVQNLGEETAARLRAFV